MNTPPESDPARARIIRQRNIALALVLALWVVLVFAVSIVKMH